MMSSWKHFAIFSVTSSRMTKREYHHVLRFRNIFEETGWTMVEVNRPKSIHWPLITRKKKFKNVIPATSRTGRETSSLKRSAKLTCNMSCSTHHCMMEMWILSKYYAASPFFFSGSRRRPSSSDLSRNARRITKWKSFFHTFSSSRSDLPAIFWNFGAVATGE